MLQCRAIKRLTRRPALAKALEDENTKLQPLLADAMLDNVALKVHPTKILPPSARREAVADLTATCEMSEQRVCQVIRAGRKMVRYRSCRPNDAMLRSRLRELAAERRRFGYWRQHIGNYRESFARGQTGAASAS